MGKQKSRTSTMSSGKMKAIRKAREEKRQAKFAAKRDAGTAYKYQSITEKTGAKEGSQEYIAERNARAEKAKSSRCDYAVTQSVMKKLQNRLDKEADALAKMKRADKKDKK